jgi:hypothetical protein
VTPAGSVWPESLTAVIRVVVELLFDLVEFCLDLGRRGITQLVLQFVDLFFAFLLDDIASQAVGRFVRGFDALVGKF